MIKVLHSDDVREMCVKYGFYTCGDNEAYTHLLEDLCHSVGNDVSITDIEKIARDIVSHSDRSVFDQFHVLHYTDCLSVVGQLVSDMCRVRMDVF